MTPLNELAPGEQRNNDTYNNWTYSTKLGANLTDNLRGQFRRPIYGFDAWLHR